MRKLNVFITVAVVLLLIVVGAVTFFLGDKHAVETMKITRVTPDQIATAMAQDHFYTDYRGSTLLVSGTVKTVNHNNNQLVVGFQTAGTFQAQCDFGNAGNDIKQGDTITILSEGGSAERQPTAVLLHGCTIP